MQLKSPGTFFSNWHLFTFRGIPVQLNWSIVPLVIYVFGKHGSDSLYLHQHVFLIGFLMTILLSVLLHEMGHAIAGLYYGIKTERIVLNFLGGLAYVNIPKGAYRMDFWVTAAGPATNAILACIFWGSYQLFGPVQSEEGWLIQPIPIYQQIWRLAYQVNFGLAIFNLIPALPLDGGRMLQNALTIYWSRSKAKFLLRWLTKLIGGGILLYGIYQKEGIYILIGGYIYLFSLESKNFPTKMHQQGSEEGQNSSERMNDGNDVIEKESESGNDMESKKEDLGGEKV